MSSSAVVFKKTFMMYFDSDGFPSACYAWCADILDGWEHGLQEGRID